MGNILHPSVRWNNMQNFSHTNIRASKSSTSLFYKSLFSGCPFCKTNPVNVFWPRFVVFLLSSNSLSQIKEGGAGWMFGNLRDQHFQKVLPLMTLVMYTCSADPTFERLIYQSRLAFLWGWCSALGSFLGRRFKWPEFLATHWNLVRQHSSVAQVLTCITLQIQYNFLKCTGE